jgi:uncharacterized lipoprotein YajG
MKRTILTVILLSLLTSCAPPPQSYHYVSPKEQAAQAKCNYEMEMYFAGKGIAENLIRRPRLLQSCMAAQGF